MKRWKGRFVLLLLSLGVWGCGEDSDMLVCAPGRHVVDGLCEDLPLDQECLEHPRLPEAKAPLGEAGATCASYLDCVSPLVCIKDVSDLGRCSARCEICGDGEVCSVAGVCLWHDQEEECASDGLCPRGSACAIEDIQCHRVCDPRAPAPCGEGHYCAPRASGLGLCFSLCE